MSKGRHWKREKNRCVLCGRAIMPSEKKRCIVGSTGHMVCDACLKTSRTLQSARRPEPVFAPPTQECITPKALMQELDKTIIGQETAKRAVSIALWKQSVRAKRGTNIPKLNLLLYGPTGCGKTAIVQTAAQLAGLPFISFDASTITENGYRGRDAHDVITDLFERHRSNQYLSQAVVFLDEFDKLTARGHADRQVNSRAAQHALLRMLEDETIEVRGRQISTKQMLFVFAGAFTGMEPKATIQSHKRTIGFLQSEEANITEEPCGIEFSDFIAYGMEPEIMGRIGQIVPVCALSADDLTRILLESEHSVFLSYKRFFAENGIELMLSKREAKTLAEEALARGSGARGLNALVEKRVEPLLLKLAEGELQGPVSLMEGGVEYARVC